MKIFILFDWRMEYFLCLIGPKTFSSYNQSKGKSFLILIGSWRMSRPLIRGKDFEASIEQEEQAQGKVMEVYQGRKEYLYSGKGKGW